MLTFFPGVWNMKVVTKPAPTYITYLATSSNQGFFKECMYKDFESLEL